MKYNTVIIGGGASGMCAAILIKRKLKNENILIIEALDRVGKKLIVTGNGRCNITNRVLDLSAYHGNDSDFCYNALTNFGYDFTEDFFSSLGVQFTEGENGKMYPYSLQASSVVDALRMETELLGVEVKTGERVSAVKKEGNGLCAVTDKNEYLCDNVIVATGGCAGGAKLGSFGIGYKILGELGHSLTDLSAGIVQLKTELMPIKALNGIKINAQVTFYSDNKKMRSEIGELLFTKYGVSGPPVLQVSRCYRKDSNCYLKINMLPEYSFAEIYELIRNRAQLLSSRTADMFFNGLLPKMVGYTVLKTANIKLSSFVSEFTDKDYRNLADIIYGFKISVIGNNGLDNAQVTVGGISTADFNSNTMESKLFRGIYAIGEVLDIDGDCGGFNLQWAWSSAAAAAQAIIGKYL